MLEALAATVVTSFLLPYLKLGADALGKAVAEKAGKAAPRSAVDADSVLSVAVVDSLGHGLVVSPARQERGGCEGCQDERRERLLHCSVSPPNLA